MSAHYTIVCSDSYNISVCLHPEGLITKIFDTKKARISDFGNFIIFGIHTEMWG